MAVFVMGSGGGGIGRKYSLYFSAEDDFWTTDDDGNYIFTISAQTHKCKADVAVEVYYLYNGKYRKTWGYFTDVSWFVDVDTDGNVTLGTDEKFSGKIIIR